MPKINTIATVPVPKLSDKLVGTSVGGTPVNQTNNFTLQQLKTLFDGTPVSPNLQAVLNAGNTAIQNIYLTGTIAATNATIANDASSKNLYLSERLFDRNNFQGTNGQYLISTGTGVQWSTLTIATPTLQQVLTAGNISDKDIITTGNIQGANIQGTNVTVNSNLRVIGAIADSTNSFGTSGQVLSSTVTGTDWVDLPSYSAVSPLIYNNISRQFSIQQATGTQNGYLSSADWITFNGKQNAGNYITELTGEASALGPGAVNITLNNLAVINKTLTGLAISSGVITAADSIITAFGKIQGQINGIVAGVVYKGAWNAATNTPTLTSSVGVQGNYYVVDVAGNTNLNGITDWQVGDWAIYNGSVWQKVDNTDAVTSVNGQTGIVVLNSDDIAEGTTNLYYLDSRARAAISSVATGLTYISATGVFSLTAGYSIPTVANQTNWTTAYNDSIVSAAVTGTTTKTLTLTQQDGGTITASWTDIDTNLVTSVFGRTGAVVAQAGDYSTTLVTEGTNLYYLDSRARSAISSSATGLTYTTATGVFSFTAGYSIPTDASQSNWTTAYNDSITSAAVTGTTTKTLTLNQQDGGTITASWTDLDTGLTSVGVSMPSAFNVTNSPLTSNGTIAVTGAGTASQYVRGDGTLGDFPTGGGGGGASVSYYLNGSINQGTFGGNTYYQMSKTPILGTGTDFSTSTNGYIAQFITDVGTPDALLIPGGNWNFETYFSASSGGGTPTFYIELYKYDGATFTLIASNSSNPELIAFGTTINPYYNSLAVPETVLTTNDRLAIRIYVFTSGRTITLHTEDNHLCQAITTFTTGLTALNGLTKQIQYFAVGTSGTDFNISSSVATHTFNLPTASATNRGALSAADWSTFNAKQNALTLTTTGTSGAATLVGSTLNIPQYQASGTYVNSVTASSPLASSGGVNSNITIQQATATQDGFLSSTDWSTFNSKQNAITLTTTGTSGAATLVGSTLNIPQYQSVLTNPITGTGTTNFLPKFTGSTTVGNSALYDGGGFGGFNSTGLGSRTFVINAASGRPLALELIENANVHAIYFRPNNSGYNLISSNYISGVVYLPLSLSARENNADLVLATSGNVLIGTTTDNGARLQVSGAATFSSSVTAASLISASATFSNFGSETAAVVAFADGNTGFFRPALNTLGITTAGTERMRIKSNGDLKIQSGNLLGWSDYSAGSTGVGLLGSIENLQFYSSGTERMRITSGGNLLVGTTSDNGARLNLNGSQYIRGGNELRFYRIDNAIYTQLYDAGSTFALDNRNGNGFSFQSAGTPQMTITSSGNVGIGTSSPAYKLVLESASTTYASSPSVAFYDTVVTADARNWMIGNIATDYGSFNIASSTTQGGVPQTPRLTINRNGNVGIGTSSPSSKLEIVGDAEMLNLRNSTTSTITGRIGVRTDGAMQIYSFQSGVSYKPVIFGVDGGFLSAGNVLIGTTSDNGARLQVSGAATFSSSVTTNAANNFNISSGPYNAIFHNSSTSTSDYNSIRITQGATGSATGYFGTGGSAVGNTSFANTFVIGTQSNHAFVLNTNDTERMRITSSGNVGIGTTSPATRLMVQDSANTYVAHFSGLNQANGIAIGTNSSNVAVIQGYTRTFSATNNIAMQVDGGNVGIGTSSPNGKLRIQNDNSTIPSLIVRDGGTPTANLIEATSNAYGSSFIVTATGNVGIGTSSPTFRLDIQNNTQAFARVLDTSTNASLILQAGSGSAMKVTAYNYASSTALPLYIQVDGANTIMQSGGGNVLMGTTTDNGNRLRVNGVGFFDSGIRTGQPVGTTTNNWLLGRALISGTSTPNRWIRVQIGLEYYDILAVYMGTL